MGMPLGPVGENKTVRTWFNITTTPSLGATVSVAKDGIVSLYAFGAAIPLIIKPGESAVWEVQVHSTQAIPASTDVYVVKDRE